MGIACCKLLNLFCCPPCISSIVSKIAFNAPTCTYSVVKNRQGQNELKIINNSFNLSPGNSKYIDYHEIKRGGRKERLSLVHIRTASYTKNTMVISHGNAVDMGMIMELLVQLGLRLRLNIVCYDYSGYGLSSGRSSERALYGDIESVLEYVREVLEVPPAHVVVYGQSIGSVPSVYIVGRHRVGLLVLHSPLASGCRLLHCCSLLGCCDVLDNFSKVSKIKTPTLIIHGVDDTVVPIEHSYHIMSRLPQQYLLNPLFIEGANHNDCEMFPEYLIRLKDVIEKDLPRFQNNFSNSLFLS